MPELIQFRCNECGGYTKATPMGEEPPPEATYPLHKGAWVTTGLLCPECSAKIDVPDVPA